MPVSTRLKLAVLLLLALLGAGCARLPPLEGRTDSTVLADTRDTRLAIALAPALAAHPGQSGVLPLADSHQAFAARVLLARAAERSLDIQYYIWRRDVTGRLLFHELQEAAERGVRVRLLLDDNNTVGLDPLLWALDAHPNIEIRLFNPFAQRSLRWLGFLTDFRRLNRRMHNKSFTADNQAAIIGGRNIGDEYFGADAEIGFADLDVLGVGPVAAAVSEDFDRYWASASSYPASDLLSPLSDAESRAVLAGNAAVRDEAGTLAYTRAIRDLPFVADLLQGRLSLEWTDVRMISDDPAKALGKAGDGELLPDQLWTVIGEPRTQMDLVSPYFVPTAAGTAAFTRLARSGVQVRVLTNALESTDVAVVHSGYAKRRPDLLKGGVQLYEHKREGDAQVRLRDTNLSAGSSASSLHAKTFAVDGARVFIGSFNFDPRSAHLNTEMGFVIESAALAGAVDQAFGSGVPERAYEVKADADGRIYWLERRDGRIVRHEVEPGTSAWLRGFVFLVSLLPIESLL